MVDSTIRLSVYLLIAPNIHHILAAHAFSAGHCKASTQYSTVNHKINNGYAAEIFGYVQKTMLHRKHIENLFLLVATLHSS